MDIYGTLGPACSDKSILESMFRCGMTGIRVNLSHITLPDAAEQICNFHAAAVSCRVKPELLIDMQGPELRIGNLEEPVKMEVGDWICLGGDGIPVPEIMLPYFELNQEILLDDGKILVRICEKKQDCIRAEVVRGGRLTGRKSISISGVVIPSPTMTESDMQNIALAKEFGVTGIMQPFVRNRQDLETVRAALDENGAGDVRILAKIENMVGVNHLEELLPAADEIVIARGDLGNDMNLWELPAMQKRIAAICRREGKNFMVVTQMLESMMVNPVPTRAEVSDIFNAVLDGASAVMVTGETAMGSYPVETMRYLSNTVRAGICHLYNRSRDTGRYF